MMASNTKQLTTTFALLATMMMGTGTAMDILMITPSNTPISATVSYSCKLYNLWTSNRHPVQYPRSAHWTEPVMVAHSSAYIMWQGGGLSSRGMEQLAELGRTSTLLGEISGSGGATGLPVTGEAQFGGVQTLPSVIVTRNHHMISVATMAGPSPDWFTGFSNFDARNLGSGTWLGEFVLETYPWDAGTEQGSTFSLGNPAESPHRPISQHTLRTFPNNGQILSMARFECSLEVAPTSAPVPAPTSAPIRVATKPPVAPPTTPAPMVSPTSSPVAQPVPSPIAPPPVTTPIVPAITRLDLVDTSQPARRFIRSLARGTDTIGANEHEGKLLSIQAISNDDSAISNVQFYLDGVKYRTESLPEWAMNGNIDFRYSPASQLSIPGLYSLTVTPYGKDGKPGQSAVVRLRVE